MTELHERHPARSGIASHRVLFGTARVQEIGIKDVAHFGVSLRILDSLHVDRRDADRSSPSSAAVGRRQKTLVSQGGVQV